MKPSLFRFWSFSASALFFLLVSHPIKAQIVPDTTLRVNSNVTIEENTSTITGGTAEGRNLFHSFREFSIPSGSEAFFNNGGDVQNIISRVTGRSISDINGLIRANGTANLFLINPNGIIFGPNASLNIGGSFVASTADTLRFQDGREFSATNPQATPLLTISVPMGLQFGSNLGGIVNQSQASPSEPVNGVDFPVGLQVSDGKTLALVGSNISQPGGILTAFGGRIELGSIGTGVVTLSEIPQGYALEYSGVQNFQDIELSGGALVNASGEDGGDVHLQARNINLTGDSQIFSTTATGAGANLTIDATESVNLSGDNTSLSTETSATRGAGNLTIITRKLTVENGAFIQALTNGEAQGGDLLIKASDAVELSGTTTDGFPSSLSALVLNIGNGGNLIVETQRLTIQDGARIEASTLGEGQAGNVLIKATDVELQRVARIPNILGQFLSSGIFAQANPVDTGNAGNLTIETQRLTVLGGAQISTATFSSGDGGTLTINASDAIKLIGTSPFATASPQDTNRSGIFVSAEPGATGDVGNLTINTELLSVEDGARISADNIGTSQGGTATLNVRQLVIRNGGQVRSGSFAEGPGGTLSVNATESVEIIGTRTIDSQPVPSLLSAEARSSGEAGDLNITTPSLIVQDGAGVSVSGTDNGPAGNLTITANDLRLNQGRLTATTNAGEGANIRLQDLDLLLMENQSLISAQAFNNANGGNITIDAADGFVVAVSGENNDIIASAVQGQGGEIDIIISGIFGIDQRRATPPNMTNDIDASSAFGLAGSVNINTLEVEPVRGLLQLPINVVDASTLIASNSCAAFADSDNSALFITGRGGLPPNPYEPLATDVVWSDTRISNVTSQQAQTVTTTPLSPRNPAAMTPATGWMFNGKGEVTLISHASGASGLKSTSARDWRCVTD
jgi:filamentous hemagglutinin family protein